MFNQSEVVGKDLFLLSPKTIYTVSTEQMSLLSLMKQIKAQTGTFPGLMTTDDVFIDYLTVKENMLVALSLAPNQPKRTTAFLVNELLEELNISESLAKQSFTALSMKQYIQLQLQIALMSHKKVIVIDDWVRHETTFARQEWLLLFRHFARTTACSFIFATSDEQILSFGKPLKITTATV